jgi:UDP-N-acetyl-D-mannosaminuronic acid transferase (WecB/TagA/CpsF family)
MERGARFERILGVRFVVDGAEEAIDGVCRDGGLVVMPSAPALELLSSDRPYREAVLAADLALPDSTLMVMLWRIITRKGIHKLSGLRYLRGLLSKEELRREGSSFWVMPSVDAVWRNASWLRKNGVRVAAEDIYVAPMYIGAIHDDELLRRLEVRRPRHVVLCLSGGKQERLGHDLMTCLSYRPAIHCAGAAIAFLSGDQVQIPAWIDQAGLGWLWRIGSNPRLFLPRYWAARGLIRTMMRYRDRLPCAEKPSVALSAPVAVAPAERFLS